MSRCNSSHFAGVVNGIACYQHSGWALPASVRIAQVTLFCIASKCTAYGPSPFRDSHPVRMDHQEVSADRARIRSGTSFVISGPTISLNHHPHLLHWLVVLSPAANQSTIYFSLASSRVPSNLILASFSRMGPESLISYESY